MAIYKFIKLYKELVSILGTEEANLLFPEYTDLPDKMDKKDQIAIASCVMQRMDKSLDKDTIIKIRHCNPCNLPKQQRIQMMELWEKSKNIDDFLTSYGCIKQDDGTYIISSLSFGLAKCVCNLFYKVDDYEPISTTWCECCNAHTSKSFYEICKQPVKTELIESIASGGKACVYKITVL